MTAGYRKRISGHVVDGVAYISGLSTRKFKSAFCRVVSNIKRNAFCAMSLLTLESCNKIIVRRDSKDSCYSEEMTEDLSATNIDDCCRLSPLATLSPVSRKSSGSDSAVSMEYEGELSGVSYL